jgi:hypothetical protein
MRFDSQGRLISPSGAPVTIGQPIPVDTSSDVDDDNAELGE